MNKLIYTAIIGKGMSLKEPEEVCEGWDYACFTDQDIKSESWKIYKHTGYVGLSNRRKSRTGKILWESGHDISIYMDSRFRPIPDLDSFVKTNLKDNDITVCNHKQRNCIYQEGDYLIKRKITNRKKLLGQLNRYRKDGYPETYGLWTPNVMIRKKSTLITEFQNFWWDEYLKGCDRDMISLAYTLRKFPELKLGIMQFRGIYNRWIK